MDTKTADVDIDIKLKLIWYRYIAYMKIEHAYSIYDIYSIRHIDIDIDMY